MYQIVFGIGNILCREIRFSCEIVDFLFIATFTYLYDSAADMPDTLNFEYKCDNSRNYVFSCSPCDVWNAFGNPINGVYNAE